MNETRRLGSRETSLTVSPPEPSPGQEALYVDEPKGDFSARVAHHEATDRRLVSVGLIGHDEILHAILA